MEKLSFFTQIEICSDPCWQMEILLQYLKQVYKYSVRAGQQLRVTFCIIHRHVVAIKIISFFWKNCHFSPKMKFVLYPCWQMEIHLQSLIHVYKYSVRASQQLKVTFCIIHQHVVAIKIFSFFGKIVIFHPKWNLFWPMLADWDTFAILTTGL